MSSLLSLKASIGSWSAYWLFSSSRSLSLLLLLCVTTAMLPTLSHHTQMPPALVLMSTLATAGRCGSRSISSQMASYIFFLHSSIILGLIMLVISFNNYIPFIFRENLTDRFDTFIKLIE